MNESQPIVDARLDNGDRVHVVLPPVAVNGPIITIRRFPKEPITMNRLLELDSLSEEEAVFLRNAVRAGYSILIAGGTGSGKTTFLNADVYKRQCQGSDARMFAEDGIPIVIFGPSDPAVGHSPNERVSIQQLIEATKVYALTALRVFGYDK